MMKSYKMKRVIIMFPVKKSKNWIIIFIIYTVIIAAALIITRIIIASEDLSGSIPGMLILAVCSSILPSIAGYFGKYIFFYIYSLSVLLGILYAFYVAIGDVAPGWGTLTSIIGYLFIVVIGLVVALIAETIYQLVKLRDSKK